MPMRLMIRSKHLALVGVAGLLLPPGLALPANQDQSSTPASSAAVTGEQSSGNASTAQLGEIIVTAERRSEPLLHVPLSVTAISSAQIQARGVTDLNAMQYAVPGLTISQNGPGNAVMQLNGIGSGAGGTSGLPTVGIYLDEMPVTGAASTGIGALDIRLLDMERVEVLNGPQPTLYGEGSMGGTIHYVTTPPNLRTFGGYVDSTVGSVTDGGTSYWTHGVLNAPLIPDVLAIRLALGKEEDAGWIDSLANGRKNVNDMDINTIRGTVLLKPLDGLSVSLMAMHQDHNQPYLDTGMKNRTTTGLFPAQDHDSYDIDNLIIRYDLGFSTLVSSTGYLRRDPTVGTDASAYLVPFLSLLGLPPGFITTIGLPTTAPQSSFSQELRLNSENSGPFGYVVGAYFRNYHARSFEDTVTSPGSLPFQLIAVDNRYRDSSWAVYGEARYALTSALEALVGLRHYHDSQDSSGMDTFFGIPAPFAGRGTFTSNNPRFNLSYQTAHGIIYANVAKGFRSGGTNSTAGIGVPPTFGPESLWTYQLGTKQLWLDNRLSLDTMAYYNRWNGIQTTGVTSSGLSFTGNGGKASGPGGNLTLTGRPLQGLTLAGAVAYTDMKYDVTTVDTDRGDPVDLVSRWTYSVSGDYRHLLAGTVNWIAHLDFGHTSGYQVTVRSLLVNAINRTDARNVLNARFGVDFGRVEVYLFGTNITDDNGTLYPAFGAQSEPVLSTPRTIGLELRGSL